MAASDPPVESCTSGASGLSLGVDNAAAGSFQPSLTKQYRAVYTSTYSTHANRIAYDEFSIRVEHPCYNSVASLVTGMDDAVYKVDSTSTATDYTPNFDPDSGCAYTLAIKIKLAS